MPLTGPSGAAIPVQAGDPSSGGPTSPELLSAVVRLWAETGGEREFEVVGESMNPILDGAQRIRARMGDRDPRFGDIVLFYRGGNLIAHRVVGRTRGGVLTRGDATRGLDEPVPREELLGVVTHLLWGDRVVPLEGFGAGPLRLTLGLLSRVAGVLRVSPAGPVPGVSRSGRIRDVLLGPPYRLCVRAGFDAFVAASRLVRRTERFLPRAESRLLLSALRREAGLARTERARFRALRERSWARMARRSIELAIGPGLLDGLRRLEVAGRMPEAAARDLQRAFYAQALYNTLALQDLARVVQQLNAVGVVPVVLKGGALAGRLYPNIALRCLSDLDLLVLPEEVSRADRCLRAAGYRPRTDPAIDYSRHHHLPPYVPRRGHPRVELHTGLLHPREPVRLDLEGMRAGAREARFGDARARVLRTEDQLVHAVVHLALSDRFVRGVKDLVDVDRLARSEGFEWSRVEKAAADPCLARALYYVLDLARRHLRTPVDPELFRRLARHRLPFFEDRLLRVTATRYMTTLPGGDFLGLSTARRVISVLLGPRRGSRLPAILSCLFRRRTGEDDGGGAPPAA